MGVTCPAWAETASGYGGGYGAGDAEGYAGGSGYGHGAHEGAYGYGATDGSGSGYGFRYEPGNLERDGDLVSMGCMIQTITEWLGRRGQAIARRNGTPLIAQACIRAILLQWRGTP